MGLGIHVDTDNSDASYRLSYSSVQRLRRELMLWTSSLLQSTHPLSAYERRCVRNEEEDYIDEYCWQCCTDLIKQWTNTMVPENYVNYAAMHPENGIPDELRQLGLAGLWHFVMHSDADGSWSYGECCDIDLWFAWLLNHPKEGIDLTDVKRVF